MQESVRKDKCTFRCSRKDSVVISRLRLGHCWLRSRLALIGRHPDGKCECGDSETVKHVLLQCKIYSIQEGLSSGNLEQMGKLFLICARF